MKTQTDESLYHALMACDTLPSYLGLFLDQTTTTELSERSNDQRRWLTSVCGHEAVQVTDPHVTTQFVGGPAFFHKKPSRGQWEALSALVTIDVAHRFVIDWIVSGVLQVSATDPSKGVGGATVAFGKLYDAVGKEIPAPPGRPWHISLYLYGGVPAFRSPEVMKAEKSYTYTRTPETLTVVDGVVREFPFV